MKLCKELRFEKRDGDDIYARGDSETQCSRMKYNNGLVSAHPDSQSNNVIVRSQHKENNVLTFRISDKGVEYADLFST